MNSAGQAAIFLARRCSQVTIIIRRQALAASMSQYLIDRIEAHDQIHVAAPSVVSAINGRDHLESVELRDTRSGEVRRFGSRGLFCFIGAEPAGRWLPAEVARDEDGFVLTDVAVPPDRAADRPRLPFETAMDGLFAAGDIRVGSMKRVAAAVGDGSSAIRSVHQYLAQFQDHDLSGQS
jgi:thioredoxin reductase (NADPH)